jgi:NADH-quinone oxidoreductase subunit F
MALRHAFEMGPASVVREVIESKLVGRGGAAFPCGQKWQSILSTTLPRCLICNADESEPGTFKDRVLMEGDPFALIESMIIAGFATGCEQAYLYVRGEYPLARRRWNMRSASAARSRSWVAIFWRWSALRRRVADWGRGLHLRRRNCPHELHRR